jgi:hypothetical protein
MRKAHVKTYVGMNHQCQMCSSCTFVCVWVCKHACVHELLLHVCVCVSVSMTMHSVGDSGCLGEYVMDACILEE